MRQKIKPKGWEKVASSVEWISLDMCREFLNLNTKNRRVSHTHVNELAGDIANANFVLNGDALRFDITGKMIDGQHRCLAALKAGVGFWSIVVRGLPEEAFSTIDTGTKLRGARTVMELEGELDTHILVPTLYLVHNYLYSGNFKGKVTVAEHKLLLTSFPVLREISAKLRGKKVVSVPVGLVGFLWFCGLQVDQAKTDKFIEQLVTSVGLEYNSPALLLRNILLKKPGSRGYDKPYTVAVGIKALNAVLEDRKIYKLQFRFNETMPEVIGFPRGQKRLIVATAVNNALDNYRAAIA